MGAFVKVVANGARLMCSAGSAPSMLQATTASSIQVEGKAVATVFDAKPISNIPPFGTCSIKGGPCVPSLPGLWGPSFPVGTEAVAAPMLPFNATLQCAIGGKIFVADCAQAALMIGGGDQPELSAGPTPEEREAMDRFEERFLQLWGSDEAKDLQAEELKRRVDTAKEKERKAKVDLEKALRSGNKMAQGLAEVAAEVAKARYAEARKARERAEQFLRRSPNRRGARVPTRTLK